MTRSSICIVVRISLCSPTSWVKFTDLNLHFIRHDTIFGTHITLSLGVPIETVGKMMGHMRIVSKPFYAKVTDRKVDEDMKRLKAAGMDRIPGLYEEDVIVRKRTEKSGDQLSDNKGTTL